jgi:hypothetical protein
MAFTEFESEANAKAVAQFVAKRRPPEHIRGRLDLGIEEKAQAFEVFSLVPHYQKKNTTMRNNVARVRFVRSRDEWHLYCQRADLRWHLYEPDPVHSTLHHALRVIDEDKYCCFFG